MDAQELAVIEQRMEEEHRLDREAFDRLKRFMRPAKNGNPSHSPQTPRATTAQHTEKSGPGLTHKLNVLAILNSDPSKIWDGPKMVERLVTDGKKINAKRPVAIVTRAFRSLVKEGSARRVKKGVGTIATTYRAAAEQSQEPV